MSLPQGLRSPKNAMTLMSDQILRITSEQYLVFDGPQVCKVRRTGPRPAGVTVPWGLLEPKWLRILVFAIMWYVIKV